MFHQTKGVFLADIRRERVIRTTPRFDLTGRTQQELESSLSPRRVEGGLTLYGTTVQRPNEGVMPLIWEKGEHPVVWLTVEEKPIVSIWRLEGATFQETEGFYQGFFRIGIDSMKVEVFPWREYEQRARVSKQWRRRLAELAGGDDTSKWSFSLMPIHSSAWTVIERWDTSQWVTWHAEDNQFGARMEPPEGGDSGSAPNW
jgi:hypothetical protein